MWVLVWSVSLIAQLGRGLEGRSAGAASSAVAAVVDVAPDRLLERRDLATGMAQALRFGAARADADAARAALHATRGLAARAAADANYHDASAWLAAAGGVLRPLLEHRAAVWDRVDDARPRPRCLAARRASRTISTEAAQAIGHSIENAPADLIFDSATRRSPGREKLARSAHTVPRALRHLDARKRFRDACGAFLSRAKGYLHTERGLGAPAHTPSINCYVLVIYFAVRRRRDLHEDKGR